MLCLLLGCDCQLETQPRSRERGPGRRAPSAELHVGPPPPPPAGLPPGAVSHERLSARRRRPPLPQRCLIRLCFEPTGGLAQRRALHVQLLSTSSCGRFYQNVLQQVFGTAGEMAKSPRSWTRSLDGAGGSHPFLLYDTFYRPSS